MILKIMMILAFHILKVSILNLCYIYIYAESEVKLIFSLILSAFLYDREGFYSYEKFEWEVGMETWKIQGVCSAYDFYAKMEIS